MAKESIAVPGYLPSVRNQINPFLQEIKRKLSVECDRTCHWSKPVQRLEELVRRDSIVRMGVLEMLHQVPKEHAYVSSLSELLMALELISSRAPEYNPDPTRADFFPVSTLFVYMMMTPAGQEVFRIGDFNDCIRGILKSWCMYLDSPQSRDVLNTDENGWLSPSSWIRNNLDDYLIPDRSAPHWGFNSFNDFFHRQIRPACRPVDEPTNCKVIVSANDGTLYRALRDVKRMDRF